MDDKLIASLIGITAVGFISVLFYLYRGLELLTEIVDTNRQILDRSTGTYQVVSMINERQRLDGRISAEAADDLRDVLAIIRDLKEKGVIK